MLGKEIILWTNLILLLVIFLTIMSFVVFRDFRKLVIRWLIKKFLNEKERKEINIGIGKGVYGSKISNKPIKLGKVGKINKFHQGDIIIQLPRREKNNNKSEVSEKGISSITEEKLQSKSKLTEEEIKFIKDFVKKLKKSKEKKV